MKGYPQKELETKSVVELVLAYHPLLYVTSAKHEETEEETAR